MVFYRYSRWDGTQAEFPLHEDDIMEQLSESLMGQGDVATALRSLMQRGLRGRYGQRLPGIQELLQRLRQRRQEVLDRYNLSGVLGTIQKELEAILGLEREALVRRAQETAHKLQTLQQEGKGSTLEGDLLRRLQRAVEQALRFLDGLPQEPASAIQRLKDYEFTSAEAKERFDRLLQALQQQVLQRTFHDMLEGLQGLTPQDIQRLKEFVRDLNRLLEQRRQGGQPNFSPFMERWHHLFGAQRPTTLEELVEHLQRQAAHLESLLQSLSPHQRHQLEKILQQALQDPELAEELARLAINLEDLFPMGALRREYPFQGQEPLDLPQALDVIARLQQMDELERQLRRFQQGTPGGIDTSLMEQVLGPEAAQEAAYLQRLADVLEQAGYIRRIGGRLELTPKGVRKIGQKALYEIFAYIRRHRTGEHPSRWRGGPGERTSHTRPWEFGEPFDPDLLRTLFNALLRHGPRTPVRLHPKDFEVFQSEQFVQSSTVLLIDLSLSMAMRGNFLAAKKVALALDNLIRTQFPRDRFHIVGFSTYAREVKPEKLPYLTWDEFDPYTNIQHGLMLAQKLLARCTGTRQILMISDGEPTAHLEGGQLFLQYPPSPRTIRETLKEVKRCTSKGIIINTFMLDRNSYLMDFVDQMTRINRGRVFYTSPERLGQYMLVDYLTGRRRLLA
ncbi:MAG: VWA domain-containing protein [Dehalococcoidia bacterium]|nr:VWA domain-containing protein [Dehalococcoidia bacterium]MDW8119816.1 VWA domain-containing protein [Chloroflexota bacterium]